MENGLTWTECAVPNRNWAMFNEDMEFLEKCVKRPGPASEHDKNMMGERLGLPADFHTLRMTIGGFLYEAKIIRLEDYPNFEYELIKNGIVITKVKTLQTAYDPNLGFWNIGGKLVWELGGETSVIVVDGVNFNEKYQLQGSYFPYEIKGKLIYIAKQNGKLHLVYDDKIMGPDFDEISMPYCCGMMYLFHSNGQYWFVGRREETKYLVSIQ
jgi:hypothetical protein